MNTEFRKGIEYTGVAIVYLCHDGEGNFLMSKRSEKCRDEHGNWDPGGGGLENGDTVMDTLQKEIKEEYCTSVLDHEFLGYRDVHRVLQDGTKTHWIALDFAVRVDRSQVANGEPHKFDEIGWFRLDTLPSPTHSQFPTFLKLHNDKLRKIWI